MSSRIAQRSLQKVERNESLKGEIVGPDEASQDGYPATPKQLFLSMLLTKQVAVGLCFNIEIPPLSFNQENV